MKDPSIRAFFKGALNYLFFSYLILLYSFYGLPCSNYWRRKRPVLGPVHVLFARFAHLFGLKVLMPDDTQVLLDDGYSLGVEGSLSWSWDVNEAQNQVKTCQHQCEASTMSPACNSLSQPVNKRRSRSNRYILAV